MWIFHCSRSLSFLTCTSTHPYPIPVFTATPVLGWKPGSSILPVSYTPIHDPYVYKYLVNSDLSIKDTQAETVFVGNEERIEQELTKLTHEESLIQSSNWKARGQLPVVPSLGYTQTWHTSKPGDLTLTKNMGKTIMLTVCICSSEFLGTTVSVMGPVVCLKYWKQTACQLSDSWIKRRFYLLC